MQKCTPGFIPDSKYKANVRWPEPRPQNFRKAHRRLPHPVLGGSYVTHREEVDRLDFSEMKQLTVRRH